MKKLKMLLAVLLAVLCLTGCAASLDAEKLLRAPRSDGETGQLQMALDTYLNESVQLKFPTSGQLLSPFIFGDWNGDGAQDAAILFEAQSMGKNVNLAMMEREDNHWKVTALCEGLAAEVNSVTVAAMQDSLASQILVGYGNPQTGLYLAVYAFTAEGIETLLQQTYSQLLLHDLTNSGTQDLILVLPENEQGDIELQVLTNAPEGFHLSQQITVGKGIYSGCAGLVAGKNLLHRPYLVVDGYVGTTGSSLASTIITYDAQEGRLVSYQPKEIEDMLTATQRYSAALTCRDVDGNGTVDIPTEMPWEIEEELQRRVTCLHWKDYVRGRGTDLYGLWDMERNFFLPLPEGMVEVACLRQSGSGWMICDRETEEPYLYVRVAYPSQSRGDFIRVAYLGNQQIQVKFAQSYPGLDLQSVQHGVTIL